jgi:hypothetical protein
MKIKTISLGLLYLCVSICPMLAQQKLEVKKISIFKNGSAMMTKEGSTSVQQKHFTLPIPEQTIFGTYWLSSAKENPIKNLQFKNDTIKIKKPATSFADLLESCKGVEVEIHYAPSANLDKMASGTILDFNREEGFISLAYGPQTEYISLSSVYQVARTGKVNYRDQYTQDSISRMLVGTLEKDAERINLRESYLQLGFNWIPSYYLRLKDDKSARLELKALVENYAEALNETDVELVVGAPQMFYGQRIDPMCYDNLSAASSSLDNSITAYTVSFSNALQTKAYDRPAEPTNYETPAFTTSGEKDDDLYIYQLGKLSLPKNSKGSFPIFAGSVDYKDKYEATIEDYSNFYSNRACDESDHLIEVYHSLEIVNSASVPLTTAPITVVSEKDQFMAQDQLKYTPAGATASIRLSKAVDMMMKSNEEEVSRVDEAKKIGKTSFSKEVIKGTITINNYQQKDIKLKVLKNLVGTVISSSDDAKSSKKSIYGTYNNPSSELKWELNIPAGGKKVLEYQYEVYFTP